MRRVQVRTRKPHRLHFDVPKRRLQLGRLTNSQFLRFFLPLQRNNASQSLRTRLLKSPSLLLRTSSLVKPTVFPYPIGFARLLCIGIRRRFNWPSNILLCKKIINFVSIRLDRWHRNRSLVAEEDPRAVQIVKQQLKLLSRTSIRIQSHDYDLKIISSPVDKCRVDVTSNLTCSDCFAIGVRQLFFAVRKSP